MGGGELILIRYHKTLPVMLERIRRYDISNEWVFVLDGQLLSGLDQPCRLHRDLLIPLGHVVTAIGDAVVVQQRENGTEGVPGGFPLHFVQRKCVCASHCEEDL